MVLKVCHVTSAHPRYDTRIFRKECISLSENGYDVTLIVNDSLSNEIKHGINILSTKRAHNNRFERMMLSKKVIRDLIINVNADIYHFHDPELLPEAAWVKKQGKKAIFDFHEDVSRQILYKKWIPYPIRHLISLMYRNYEKHIVKKLDAIITVTPKFVESLKESNKQTVMVTNYPIVKKSCAAIDRKMSRVICFAGGISSQWNHSNVIKALAKMDDVTYILAGRGTEEYINELKKLDGWDKVRYLGVVSYKKVLEIYNESSIGVSLLSYDTQVGKEGTMGNTKIFEFMEAGLPVICSDNKIWAGIVSRFECGLTINPNSVDSIVESIEKIFRDRNLQQSMGANGRKAVEEEFNWSSQEIKLINCYKNVADKDI